MRQSLRTLLLAIGALALGLLIAMAIALSVLDAPAHDIEVLALVLALTGSLSLIIGLGGITLAPRFGLALTAVVSVGPRPFRRSRSPAV